MRDQDGEEWLTPTDAAARLSIDRGLIYVWLKREVDIRSVRVDGRLAVNLTDVARAEHAWRTRRRGGHKRSLPETTSM